MSGQASAASLEEAQLRVGRMMLLYEKLYRRKDLSVMPANLYLDPLVQDIMATASSSVHVSGPKQLSALSLWILIRYPGWELS